MRRHLILSVPCAAIVASLVASCHRETVTPLGVNVPPTATIAAPVEGATFRAGDVLNYSGSGSDEQDGPVPPSRMAWWAVMHHDEHTHPFMPRTAGVASGSVTVPTQGETSDNIWYEFFLEVRDDSGAADTVTRDVRPQKVTMRFVTVPAGLQVTVDGQPRTTPLDVVGVIGLQRSIGVVTPQNLGSTQYVFASWSDGGTATHGIVTPTTNTTYTATFTAVAPANQPPTVSITAPAAGASLAVNAAVTVSANAADPDGTVTQVQFFDGVTAIGTDATSPFSISWTPTTTGTHSLTARATDNATATTTSAAISVTVVSGGGGDVTPPTVTLTSPANNTAGLTGAVNMQATASDNVGVAGVTFQVDGETIGAEDTSAPYAVTLPATNVYTSGQHVIRARARDTAGNLSAWAVATVSFGGNVALPQGFTRTIYVTGLPDVTAMAFAPDGRLFICEKGGGLRVVKNGVLLATPFATLPTIDFAEQGLLGITFDPNFATNRYVYVYYTVTTPYAHNRLTRLTASATNADVAAAGSEVVLYEIPVESTGNHNGGALHFGPDGKLYVAVGDHRDEPSSPLLTRAHGKILRLNSDGSIPTDNPFYTQTTGVYRAIWARGLRNSFTFGFQPGTGRMMINDVGEDSWEEINEGVAGANYGWPATEGYTTNPAYRSPIYAFPHSGGFVNGLAVIGGPFYNPASATFPAAYTGNYFFGDYWYGWVFRMDIANDNAVYAFGRMGSQLVDMRVGADGALYVLGNVNGGIWGVWRISRP